MGLAGEASVFVSLNVIVFAFVFVFVFVIVFCCHLLLISSQFDREDATITTWDSGCPDMEEHNTRDCVALVSNSAKVWSALQRPGV